MARAFFPSLATFTTAAASCTTAIAALSIVSTVSTVPSLAAVPTVPSHPTEGRLRTSPTYLTTKAEDTVTANEIWSELSSYSSNSP